jgi:peptidoglycan hydrolase-like protein with peptidoglycan-binding domain
VLTEKKAAKDGLFEGDARGQTELHPGGDAGAQTRYTGHGQIPDVEPLRDAKSLPTASQRAYGEVAAAETDEDATPSTTTGANDSGGPMNRRFNGDGTLASVELGDRTLKLGDTGRSVRKVQQALFDLNYGVKVTGTYDQATVDGVKRFQIDQKLAKTDGELDSATFEQLEFEFSNLGAYARAAQHAPPGMQHTPFKTDAKDVPVHLTETRELDDEDRAEVDIVISDTKTGASGKAAGKFKKEVDGKSYGQRVEELLVAKINEEKGDGEKIKTAHDKGKVFTMGAMVSVANTAKAQVDKIFGSFAEGPTFDGTNLVDRYEADTEKHAKQNDTKSHDDAVGRVRYFLNQSDDFKAVNRQHVANPTGDAEKDILERCIQNIATRYEDDLLFIIATSAAHTDRKTRTVSIQRRKTGHAETDRKILWKKFATMIHEYIHVLAHPKWHTHRVAKGKEDPQGGNTLGEGVPELLTRVVLEQVNFGDKALRKSVLGSTKDDGEAPEIDRGYDSPFAHAQTLVGVVGIHNLYAAYFLGETKLIGA